MTTRPPSRTAPSGRLPDDPPGDVLHLARRVVEAVQPTHLVLFGSVARGDTHRFSDVDLLVIVPAEAEAGEARRRAREAAADLPVPWDLVLVTADEVRRDGRLVGSVLRPALLDGLLLYDAEAADPWRPTRHACELEVDPVTEERRIEETLDLVEQAREDLEMARLALSRRQAFFRSACFHAQQATEKALKAVMVFLQIQYPFTHDLNLLRSAIPAGWQLPGDPVDLEWLSEWAIRGRYPAGPAPTAEEAQRAMGLAQAMLDAALGEMASRGLARPDAE